MEHFDLSEFSQDEILAIAESIKQTRDIRAFNVTCLSHHFTITPISVFHDYIFDRFLKTMYTNAREAVAAPRGYGKTSIISCSIPLFSVCLGLYRFMAICADTSGQAEDYLSVIKEELEFNENIAMLYPHAFGVGKVWRQDRIVTRNGICILALGTGGKIRGRKYKNLRPELVILDDIYNLSHKYSATLSKQVEEWVSNDVLKCGAPGRPLDVYFVGTVIGSTCLLNKFIKGDDYPIWNCKVFKAFISFPKNMELWEKWGEIYKNKRDVDREKKCKKFYIQHRKEMDEGAEVLWPSVSKTPVYDLMCEYYGEGRRAFLLEKQNEPIVEGDRVFDIGMYRFYTSEEFEEVPSNELLYYVYLDATLGNKKMHSKHNPDLYAFTVLAKWLRYNLFFVVDSICGCKPPSHQYEIAYQIVMKYPVFRFYVESISFQDLVYEGIKTLFRRKGAGIVPRRVKSVISKVAKIEALEPFLANHTILLNYNTTELLNEMEDYPNCDKDDALDSLAGCFGAAYKKYRFRCLSVR